MACYKPSESQFSSFWLLILEKRNSTKWFPDNFSEQIFLEYEFH